MMFIVRTSGEAPAGDGFATTAITAAARKSRRADPITEAPP